MVLSLEWAKQVRDKTHNLNLSLPDHIEKYDQLLEEAVMRNEVVYDGNKPQILDEPYKDTANKTTIGIGFNMDGAGARKEWRRAFGDSISFDVAYSGLRKLSKSETMHLFRTCIRIRREELPTYFKYTWYLFRANERLTIEEMFYNGPGLIRRYNAKTKELTLTNFTQNMNLYATHKDCKYLYDAREEILKRSNPDKTLGVQNRRIAEAELLSSDKCPIYSKPGEAFIPPNAHIEAVFDKTIIPYKHGTEHCNYLDKFYIWRTCSDSKVRSSHLANEDKIFSIHNPPPTGYPGKDYNCRCHADHYIPSYVVIPGHKLSDGNLLYKGSFEHFMRFGKDGNGGGTFAIE